MLSRSYNKDIRPTVATYSLVIRRLMICSVTIVVSRAMTSPLLALLLSTRLGLNQQDIGLLMGIAVFIATLLGLYGGYIIDRLEKRKLLILAMLSSSIGFLLLTFVSNLYLTTLTLVITEAASALFLIGSKAIISENLPVGDRAKVFSLRYTLTNVGYATGPMFGVVIAGHMQLAPFLIASAIAFGSLFLMIGIPPTQRDDSNKPLSFLTTLRTLRSDRTLILFTSGSLLSTIVHGRYTLYLSQVSAGGLQTRRSAENFVCGAGVQCRHGDLDAVPDRPFSQTRATALLDRIGYPAVHLRVDRVQPGGQPGYLVRGNVRVHPGRDDHLPVGISVYRHHRPGCAARQLLRRAKPGGLWRGDEPGDMWVFADQCGADQYVLCAGGTDRGGRLSVFLEWAARSRFLLIFALDPAINSETSHGPEPHEIRHGLQLESR